jgi:hypothetical protein
MTTMNRPVVTSETPAARLLVALLGLFFLVAAAHPHGTRSPAPHFSDIALLFDAGKTTNAVLPKLEQDQRQRTKAATGFGGEDATALVTIAGALRFRSREGCAAVAKPARGEPRHLAECSTAPRAPPKSV